MGTMTVTSRRLTAAARTRAAGHRHLLTLAVAGVLFVGVLSLRLFAGDATDAYSMLYVFPVALVATTFGMRAGTAAGLLAVALIAVWATADHVSLAPVAWAARVLPILLLGVLVGEATDRLRRIEAERRLLEAAALLHREAIEINDSLIQRMTVAKWALEAGRDEAALRALTDAVHEAHRLVSDLIRRADMGERAELISEVAEEP